MKHNDREKFKPTYFASQSRDRRARTYSKIVIRLGVLCVCVAKHRRTNEWTKNKLCLICTLSRMRRHGVHYYMTLRPNRRLWWWRFALCARLWTIEQQRCTRQMAHYDKRTNSREICSHFWQFYYLWISIFARGMRRMLCERPPACIGRWPKLTLLQNCHVSSNLIFAFVWKNRRKYWKLVFLKFESEKKM